MRVILYDWRKDPLTQHERYNCKLGRLVYYLGWLNIDTYLIAIVCGSLLFYLPKSISTIIALIADVVLIFLWRLVKNYYGVSTGLFKFKYVATPLFDIAVIACMVLVVKALFL